MKRRQNKSHKVPGVKLRPAQEGSFKSVAAQQTASIKLVEDSQIGSDDTAVYDTCPRPFKGVVLCATGIPDKPALFKQAVELGATPISAFTDRVTHLIAAEHGGAKYQCAVQRKIPILTPAWIIDSYQTWLRGDDVDLEETLKLHRLPLFSGVILSLSGIEDMERRKEIGRQLAKHKGTYVKNLERPVRVTHLLCSGDEETEKMRYAEKFNQRGEANIQLVWEEWFWDSIKFGGRFDEATYQVRQPRPEAKVVETPATPPPPSTLEPGPTKSLSSVQPQREDLDEEVASVKQVPAIALHLWSSLLKVRGYDVQDGKLLRSPTKSKSAIFANPNEDLLNGQPIPRKSVISSFRRTNSFAPVESKANATSRQFFRRTITNTSLFSRQEDTPPAVAALQPLEKVGETSIAGANGFASMSEFRQAEASSIFKGLRFYPRGEARSASVKTAITERGGILLSTVESEEDVDYIIVRLASGSKLYKEELDDRLRLKYRTECWLERCLFDDKICAADEHITFLPLAVELPIIGTEHINLSFSGFEQSEAFWISRLLRALGINLAKSFSRRSTHLLCPSGTGAKYEKADDWNIPVIGIAWLSALIQRAAVPPVDDYRVPPGGEVQPLPTPARPGGRREQVLDTMGVAATDLKGKSKVIYEQSHDDNLMNDITNNNGRPSLTYEHTQSPKKLISNIPSRPTSPQKPITFGKPNGVLLNPVIAPQLTHSTSASSATSSSSTNSFKLDANSDLLRTPRRSQHSRNSNGGSLPTRPNSAASTPTRTPGSHIRSRSQFLSSQNQGSQPNQVPSSRSPSPMKMPTKAHGDKHNRPPSRSPTKILVDPDAAKALHDSITSLLGKRPSEEDTVGGGLGSGAAGRKRPRPQRVKVPTREPTGDAVADNSTTSLPSFEVALAAATTSDVKSIRNPFEPFGGDTSLTSSSRIRTSGSPGAILSNPEGEPGIRVMFEDPQQIDERKRLMDLLKTQAEGKIRGNRSRGADDEGDVRVEIVEGKITKEPRPRRSARNMVF